MLVILILLRSVRPCLWNRRTTMITRRPVRMDLRSVWTSLRRSGRAMMLLLWRTNSYIEITTTVHIIRHSVMADTIMAIVHIMAVMVTIMGLIITDIIEMSTIMPSAITSIVMRFAIVEKIHIINGKLPHALLLEIFTRSGVGTQIIR